MNKKRCDWVKTELDIEYHDYEWGKLRTDDRYLFEMLSLEGMQSGLSWNIILKKRKNLKKVFDDFNFNKCATYSDEYLYNLLSNEEIIRNKLKIFSVRNNSQKFLKTINEFGNFYNYLHIFIKKIDLIKNKDNIKIKKELANLISKDLKRRGFKFVGETIIYSYLQAVGIFNDHSKDCFLYYQ